MGRRATAQLRQHPAHRDAQVRDGRRLRELPLGRRAEPSWYAPYADAIRAAATPGNVDPTVPTLHAAATAGRIHGTAHDNLAVWVVRWRDDLGGRGVAELDFRITEGDMLHIKDWQMDWSVPREALTDGASSVTVAAVDIKRNIPSWSRCGAASCSVTLTGAAGSQAPPGLPSALSGAGASAAALLGACHVASRLRLCALSPPA